MNKFFLTRLLLFLKEPVNLIDLVQVVVFGSFLQHVGAHEMKLLKATKFFISAGLVALFFYIAPANAAMSQQEFLLSLQQDSTPVAVQTALSEGMSVEDIIKYSLAVEGINPYQILVALFQNGANSRDITQAATKFGISPVMIVAASEESQSGKSDTQAYTAARDVTRNVVPSPGRSGSGGGSPANEPYVSPSTFVQ